VDGSADAVRARLRHRPSERVTGANNVLDHAEWPKLRSSTLYRRQRMGRLVMADWESPLPSSTCSYGWILTRRRQPQTWGRKVQRQWTSVK
jgi:hypothetical protein